MGALGSPSFTPCRAVTLSMPVPRLRHRDAVMYVNADNMQQYSKRATDCADVSDQTTPRCRIVYDLAEFVDSGACKPAPLPDIDE